MSYTKDPYQGIKGWLILLTIGFVLTPFRLAYAVYATIEPVTRPGTWQVLTNPSGEFYHPLLLPLVIFEIIGNSAFLAFSILLVIMLFRKKSAFPRLAIVFFLGNLSFIAIDYCIGGFIPVVASDYGAESFGDLGRVIVSCLIWVPYMLISKRVKATFIE